MRMKSFDSDTYDRGHTAIRASVEAQTAQNTNVIFRHWRKTTRATSRGVRRVSFFWAAMGASKSAKVGLTPRDSIRRELVEPNRIGVDASGRASILHLLAPLMSPHQRKTLVYS
jgi:hypothetical protein